MPALSQCTECGAELRDTEQNGLCTRCLLSLGLTAADGGAGETHAPLHFGDYEQLEEIARGGMGIVYKARQVSLGRNVALKMILAGQFAAKEFVQRFRGEAAAAAILQHPNIVAVHEVGVHENQHFFSMDYVEGRNLAQLVGNRPLPPQKAARYVKLIAGAIHYAHQQGILHRDLKPSNVLIDAASDQPRLTDFGLARRLDGASSLTVTGQVLGSPNFMPPEQASGSRGKVGRHSDVYGLGGILYHLLTARAPFQAESLEGIVTQVLNTEPVPPRLLNPVVPRDLETICLKCLEKEPAKRYPTAQALADELDRFLSHEPIHARPVSRTERAWRWCRRKPAVAGFGAATAVLLLTFAIGAPIALWRITSEKRRAEQEAASRRVQLYAAEVNLAGEALAGSDLNRARELLARQIPTPSETNDLRGFEWRYLWQQSQSAELTTLGQHEAGVHGVRFSPDGTLLASSEINGTVKLWDYRTRKLIATLRDTTNQLSDGDDAAVKPLAFSPDGGRLAVGVGRDIVLWEVASHQRIAVLKGHSKRVNFLVFAREGRILASGANDGLVKVWDVTPAEPRAIATLQVGIGVGCLAFSYDGKTLAASGFDPSIKRWNLSNLEAPVELPPLEAKDGHPGWVWAMAFSPDTNLLISADTGGEMIAWDLASDPKEFSPRKLTLPHGSIGIVNAVGFTPDGQTMLSAGTDNNITLWDLSGRGQPLKLKGHVWEIFSIDVSPDGRTLASGGDDRTVKLWDISARWREQPKMSHGEHMFAVAISPDSKFIASLSPKKLGLWDAATEEPLAQHPRLQRGEGDGHLVFSPDSNILAAEGNGTGTIRLLKVPSFEEITNFRGSRPLFSPDGTELVYFLRDAERYGIYWRNLKTQEERVWKTEWDVSCLAISPDGRSIAGVKEGGRSVWTWHAHAPDHPVEIEAPLTDEKLSNYLVWDVAFSPDGHWLASASWDGRVRLWNLDNPHEKVQPLKAHSGAAWAVAFSPDGRTLATGGDDATIKLWNLASLQQTATLRGHTGPVNGLAFSRDGTLLASSSNDGTARLWRAPTFQEIDKTERERPSGK